MSSRPGTSLSYASRREVIERVATHYREASSAQKTLLLDRVVAITGYARKYAIQLLNHPPQGKRTIQRPRQPRYGSQVQHALVFAWKATRQICAKRLVPFLPTCVAALEQHGHLQLTQEDRSQLLRMSASTAERFLRSQQKPTPRGLSTTHAGPLLKHRIPLRTFHQWDNAQPGFLEADLVAHCGGHSQGCFLWTLTLTDVATGWTECLPVLSKSPEAVLAAFQQARRLFPFPILGLDTDNGGEFINKKLLSYCEQEQITFSRGRPHLKDDQGFVEQKNGAIVRQFVGFDRLAGYQASRQLRELYRALRLYVNCFQPSMKLVSKHYEGATVRRVYDPAKTPLQRLLLSGVMSATAQQHLREVMQALDPLLLLHQLERLQQAVWRCAHHTSSLSQSMPAESILHFSVEGCLEGPLFSDTSASVLQTLRDAPQSDRGLLDWPRTARDPFEGAWEQILSWVLTHPEWSGGDLLQHVQRVFPGRYTSSHLRTLQSGLRKIRTRVREIVEEPWPEEVIQASRLMPLTPQEDQQKTEPRTDPVCSSAASAPSARTGGACVELHQPTSEEEAIRPPVCAHPVTNEHTQSLDEKGNQPVQTIQVQCLTMTIEGAIQAYLQEQKNSGRSHKTMEWHQTSLGLLQQYLVSKRLCFLSQITEREVHDWVTFLRTTPSATGTLRRNNSIATYGRSARAFCHWLVRTGSLDQTPIPRGTMPRADTKSISLIEPDQFDRLLLACHTREDGGSSVNQAAVRNRALLWVLRDTGMRVCELCALRLSDVDREQGMLRIEGRGHARWIMLSPHGWYQLLCYVDQPRPKGRNEEDSLFFSETYQPLTSNTITLLFHRLKKRAGMSETGVSPSALRDTFAVCSLQAGGTPEALSDILGLTHVTAVKRYQRLINQTSESDEQKESAEEHQSRERPGPHTRKRRQKRSSSVVTKKSTPQGGDKPQSSRGKESVTGAEKNP